jgi:NAD(P)-dependent dehydrogenase (short-subunit alcohol dehydrogenase family)
MAGRLEDKLLLITGGTGIAAATARLARQEGARVFLAGSIAEEDLPFEFYRCDLTKAAEAAGAVQACIARYGSLDALYNVAGISGRRYGDGPLHLCSEQGWDMTMDTNVKSMFLVSRAVLSYWLGQKRPGVILNMASVIAFSPEPRNFAAHAYAASKAAVIGLTRSLAAFYAPHGIRVNAIAPGLVRTPMSRRAQQDPAIQEQMKSKQPLAPDMIEPSDVAFASVFLLSDESRAVTGEVFTLDGGWSVRPS